MIHFQPNVFWEFFPIIVKYMDEKALLNASSVSINVNACVSSNVFWEKHLYTNSCKKNLQVGEAKLRYFEHVRVYHLFFSKALKMEPPKHFIEVRDVVEKNLMKDIHSRASQLADFFTSQMKLFLNTKDETLKTTCDQNMQMLLKEGARIKPKKLSSLLEKAVNNGCSFITIEMMFERGGECNPSYIYDAIISKGYKRRVGQSSLILAQRIPRIDLKNQSRFCKILQAQVSDRTVECLAAKVEHVSIDTLLCALQNKYPPKILGILYENFSPRIKKEELNFIDFGIGEEEVYKAIMAGFSDEIVTKIINGVNILNPNLIFDVNIQEKTSATLTCRLIEKISSKNINDSIVKFALLKCCPEEFVERILAYVPKISAATLEEAVQKEYSERVVLLLVAKIESYDYINQAIFYSAIQRKYAGATIRLLVDTIAPYAWIKLDVIKSLEEGGYEKDIIHRLERWNSL